jgi:hypothetical protein
LPPIENGEPVGSGRCYRPNCPALAWLGVGRWLAPLRHFAAALGCCAHRLITHFQSNQPVANLVIVPLSSLALRGLERCCGDWLPRIRELFSHAAWW